MQEKSESCPSILQKLESFDEVPMEDPEEERVVGTTYTLSTTIWKGFHYTTLRVSTTRNAQNLLEQIIGLQKECDYKHIESYPIVRQCNGEVWLMKLQSTTALFDEIFTIDDISEPLAQMFRGVQYLYSHNKFHGSITKRSIRYSPSKLVTIADSEVLYLLDGNICPSTDAERLEFACSDCGLTHVQGVAERSESHRWAPSRHR